MVHDENKQITTLRIPRPDGSTIEEVYEVGVPGLVIGGIVLGERFTEPFGPAYVFNKNTGHICDLEFKSLINSKAHERGMLVGCLKDENGVERFTISGRYQGKMEATDLKTGETFTVFEVPKFPAGPQEISKIYGMNLIALQNNTISEKLRAKLPPTDTRLRNDLRCWENGDMQKAQDEF